MTLYTKTKSYLCSHTNTFGNKLNQIIPRRDWKRFSTTINDHSGLSLSARSSPSQVVHTLSHMMPKHTYYRSRRRRYSDRSSLRKPKRSTHTRSNRRIRKIVFALIAGLTLVLGGTWMLKVSATQPNAQSKATTPVHKPVNTPKPTNTPKPVRIPHANKPVHTPKPVRIPHAKKPVHTPKPVRIPHAKKPVHNPSAFNRPNLKQPVTSIHDDLLSLAGQRKKNNNCNRKWKDVGGGGDCLFRCLAYLRYNDKNKHPQVRKELCDFTGPSFDFPIRQNSKMREIGTDGDSDMIYRASEKYQKNIIVCSDNEHEIENYGNSTNNIYNSTVPPGADTWYIQNTGVRGGGCGVHYIVDDNP